MVTASKWLKRDLNWDGSRIHTFTRSAVLPQVKNWLCAPYLSVWKATVSPIPGVLFLGWPKALEGHDKQARGLKSEHLVFCPLWSLLSTRSIRNQETGLPISLCAKGGFRSLWFWLQRDWEVPIPSQQRFMLASSTSPLGCQLSRPRCPNQSFNRHLLQTHDD